MTVSYGLVGEFQGWERAPQFFESLIAEHGSKRVLEIGSGANPTLAPELVQRKNLSYVTSDLSAEELEKANAAFERLVLDLSVEVIDPALHGAFDCIVSRMVAEHIKDGHQYHSNLYKMLRPGGISAHCFSTLWTIPFAANRLLPEWLADFLLGIFNPRDRHKHGKFPAYYSWGRGPSRKMIRRYEDLGFEVIRYDGYFGHPYYRRIPPLAWLEALKSRLLVKHPVPQLCSYSTIVLRKPMQ